MFQAIFNLFKPTIKPITLKDGTVLSERDFLERMFRQPAIFSTDYDDDFNIRSFKIVVGDDLNPAIDIVIPYGTQVHVPLRGTFPVKTNMDVERLFTALETTEMDPW